MNYNNYKIYKSTRKLMEFWGICPERFRDKILFEELNESVKAWDLQEPNYSKKYEEEIKMHDLFTEEQKNFICNQIGDWYIEWKNKMWHECKPNQHYLGIAKEQLKNMICGS